MISLVNNYYACAVRDPGVLFSGIDMNFLTFSEARASPKTVMDNVCRDHIPMVITRQNADHVVMVSLADFNSIQETLYLLGSEANARRLMESVSQLRDGKAKERVCSERLNGFQDLAGYTTKNDNVV